MIRKREIEEQMRRQREEGYRMGNFMDVSRIYWAIKVCIVLFYKNKPYHFACIVLTVFCVAEGTGSENEPRWYGHGW